MLLILFLLGQQTKEDQVVTMKVGCFYFFLLVPQETFCLHLILCQTSSSSFFSAIRYFMIFLNFWIHFLSYEQELCPKSNQATFQVMLSLGNLLKAFLRLLHFREQRGWSRPENIMPRATNGLSPAWRHKNRCHPKTHVRQCSKVLTQHTQTSINLSAVWLQCW